MSETIAGYHNTLQILNTLTPSVTITGTIKAGSSIPSTIGNLEQSFGAVYGPGAANFDVTNLGLIIDTETKTSPYGNAGIVLGGTGTVINRGTILTPAGEGQGVYLYHGGTVINSGTIIGDAQGIFVGISTLTNGRDFIWRQRPAAPLSSTMPRNSAAMSEKAIMPGRCWRISKPVTSST